jgi:hypothetical protein
LTRIVRAENSSSERRKNCRRAANFPVWRRVFLVVLPDFGEAVCEAKCRALMMRLLPFGRSKL